MTHLLKQTLVGIGYHVTSLPSVQSPLVVFGQQLQPDFVLVDDPAVCRWLREYWQTVLIVIYGSRADTPHITHALDQGADAYIVVPFAREEFAARMRALLRRTTWASDGERCAAQTVLCSSDGSIVLNAETYRLQVNGAGVHLTKTEFRLLHCLLQHRNTVLSNRFLLETIWGSEYQGMDDYVRVYIRRLRQKIEPDPANPTYIQTKLTQGYTFQQREVR
jgi:two-component system KDP operon response regulator KdpE